MIQQVYKICTQCNGSGKIRLKRIDNDVNCHRCNSKRYVKTDFIVFSSGDPRDKSLQLKEFLDGKGKSSRST